MFAVVYSKNTGRVRWHTSAGQIVNELSGVKNLKVGEEVLVLDDAFYTDINNLQILVNKQTGIPLTDDRCVVVNNFGIVETEISADPLIDTLPAKQIIKSPTAQVGWQYNATTKTFSPTP